MPVLSGINELDNGLESRAFLKISGDIDRNFRAFLMSNSRNTNILLIMQ